MERTAEARPKVSPFEIFSIASIIARKGVLMEDENGDSKIEYKGTYHDGQQNRPIAISLAEFQGHELIKISIDGVDSIIKRITQANTSPNDEYSCQGSFPDNILHILVDIRRSLKSS